MKIRFGMITLATLVLFFLFVTLYSRTTAFQHLSGDQLQEMNKKYRNPTEFPRPDGGVNGDYVFILSIEVNETIFDSSKKAIVIAKIKNATGKTVNSKELRYVTFNLSKRGKDAEDIRSSELFTSFFLLCDKQIKNGESFEFDVDLKSLNWKDSLSSAFDFTNTKNMFEAVPSGDYYLFGELLIPAEHSTNEDPRVVSVKSNEVMVTVKRK